PALQAMAGSFGTPNNRLQGSLLRSRHGSRHGRISKESQMTLKPLALAIMAASAGAAMMAVPGPVHAQTADTAGQSVDQKIQAMQARIDALQAELNALKKRQQAQASAGTSKDTDKEVAAESSTEDEQATTDADQQEVATADTATSH